MFMKFYHVYEVTKTTESPPGDGLQVLQYSHIKTVVPI